MLPLVVHNQASCLSEIEKCIIFHLVNDPGLRTSQIRSRSGLPRHFLDSVVRSLERKGIVQQGPADSLHVDESILPRESREDPSFLRLSTKGTLVIPRSSRFLDLLVDKIDFKCQHAIDLYSLHYYEETIDQLKEIIIMMKTHFIPVLEITFHEFDATFLSWFYASVRKDKDRPSLDVDMAMAFVCKIQEEIKHKRDAMVGLSTRSTTSDSFLDEHAEFLVDLSSFVAQRMALIDVKQHVTSHQRQARFDCLLFFFDNKVGPVMYHSTNDSFPTSFLEKIKKLMDLVNDEPFSFMVDPFNTINYQFHVDSPRARGKTLYLQVSLVAHHEKDTLLSLHGIMVKEIAKRLQELDGLHLLFEQPNEPSISSHHGPLQELDAQLKSIITSVVSAPRGDARVSPR